MRHEDMCERERPSVFAKIEREVWWVVAGWFAVGVLVGMILGIWVS